MRVKFFIGFFFSNLSDFLRHNFWVSFLFCYFFIGSGMCRMNNPIKWSDRLSGICWVFQKNCDYVFGLFNLLVLVPSISDFFPRSRCLVNPGGQYCHNSAVFRVIWLKRSMAVNFNQKVVFYCDLWYLVVDVSNLYDLLKSGTWKWDIFCKNFHRRRLINW